MNLSLMNCVQGANALASNIALPLWQQLNTSAPQPVLHGHHAITTVFDETEWMVVTGGYDYEGDNMEDRFHVWLLNLTHADLVGEEQWFKMDDKTNSTNLHTSLQSCSSFTFDASDDPWKRADLWEKAIECVPSPRQGHLSAILNEQLYIFQGSSENEDYHVYRISIRSVLLNDWTAWRRILPRESLNSTSTAGAPLRGGLWHRSQELPRLVAFAGHAHDDPYWHCCEQTSAKVSDQIWVYDFTEDAWELWYQIEREDFNHGDYSAIVVGQFLLVVGSDRGQENPIFWMNLESKELSTAWQVEGCIAPNQTLLTYDDAKSQETVIIGFGPHISNELSYEYHSCRPTNLGLASIQNLDDGSIESAPIQLGEMASSSPHDRTGHSAVLSSVGNMYVFGGESLLVGREAVWRINVGGRECALPVKRNNDNLFQGDVGWYVDDEFDNDDHNGGAGFIWMLFFVIQCGLCLVGSPRQMRRHIEGNDVSPRGLTPEQLEFVPQRVLCESDEHIIDESVVCSICLLNFTQGEVVRDLPCKHFFHKVCVDDWLAAETTCPLCRESCRPVVDVGEPEQSRPMLSRIMQLLHRDQREALDQSDGLEMGSRYSLEDENAMDDVSVSSNASTTVTPTTHSMQDGASRETYERRGRRSRRHIRGDGAVPLTASQGTMIVTLT